MKKLLFVCWGLTNICLAQLPANVGNPNLNVVINNDANEYVKVISNPALVASFKWWRAINPTNYEFDPVAQVGKTNRDTGIVNYSKKTKIALAGWMNPVPNGTVDDSLVHLKALSNLEHVMLGGFTGDKGVQQIAGFKNLKSLVFSRTGMPNHNLTNTGFKTISLFSNLELLEIPACPNAGAEGYNALKNLVKVKTIRLIEWTAADKDLSFLSYLRSLEKVDLNRSSITDATVAYLAGHPLLHEINLEFCAVTNKSLGHFLRMPSLKTLNISNTAIDLDSGYNEFKNILTAIPSLKSISLYRVKLSNENLTRLRNDHPGVAFHK